MATRTVDLGQVVGPQGPQGNPGPNTVSTSTTTALNGVLTGNGSTVEAKTLDESSLTNDNDHIPTSGTVKSALSTYVRPNILDNPIFTINQRGQASYPNAGYGVDRWKNADGSAYTVGADGITWTNPGAAASFVQSIEQSSELNGKTVTLSWLIDGVLYTDTATLPSNPSGETYPIYKQYTFGHSGIGGWYDTQTDHRWHVFINATGGTAGTYNIQAVKLELGDTQTLAHKEGSTWVLNEIPNYATELVKCQRYQYVITAPNDQNLTLCAANAVTTDSLYAGFSIPAQMRTPSITLSSADAIKCGASTFAITPSAATVYGYASGYITLSLTATSSFTAGTTYCVGLMGGKSIIFDANL